MHSPKFEKVKHYYEMYLQDPKTGWNKEMVRNAVIKGWITEDEYKEITGEDY